MLRNLEGLRYDRKDRSTDEQVLLTSTTPLLRIAITVALAAPADLAGAAGGHHAVDDAALLAPGACQVETWFERERHRVRTLLHVAPSCRVGPVDLELSFDRIQLADSASTSSVTAQLKWATSLNEQWSAGLVAALGVQNRRPRQVGTTIVVPLTWRAGDAVLAHVNVGRDFKHAAPDSTRAGLAVEWTPLNGWSFVGERFRDGPSDFWRAGARWAVTSSMSVDVSRAAGLHGTSSAWWTAGFNWVLDR